MRLICFLCGICLLCKYTHCKKMLSKRMAKIQKIFEISIFQREILALRIKRTSIENTNHKRTYRILIVAPIRSVLLIFVGFP